MVALEPVWDDRRTVKPNEVLLPEPFRGMYGHKIGHTSLLGERMAMYPNVRTEVFQGMPLWPVV